MGFIEDLEKKIVRVASAAASSLSISTAEQYEQSGPVLRRVIEFKDQVHATFDPIVTKANATHREANAQRKRHLQPLEEAERRLKGARGIYVQKQEVKVREERRQWEAKLAEERRQREAEAAAYRREAEKEAAFIRQEAEAEAAKLRQEGQERAAAEALETADVKAESELHEAEEVAIITETTIFEHEPIAAELPIQKGHSYRDEWRYQIKNLAALKGWLWHNEPDVLIVDEKRLRALVRTEKDGTIGIPGLHVYCDKVESVRR